MLRKRSIFLFIVLIALMGVTLVLTTIEEKKQAGSFEDDKEFSIEDVSKIDRIVMEGAGINNELIKDKGIWRIQRQYEADPSMAKVLLQALHEVRIKRPAPGNVSRRIAKDLDKKGIHVSVYEGNNLVSSFLAGGDMEKRESYFSNTEDGDPMIVYIPGYDSYVSGIFELKESDWRNRVIFQSNWTSLQNVTVSYPDEPSSNFQIAFANNFFYMPDLEQVDTTKMMAYIELYNYIEAENYISQEKFPNLDSLTQATPFVQIDVEDMNSKKNNSLKLFKPVQADQTIVGIVGNGQMAVLKYPKIQNLIKKRSDFLKN